MAVEDVAKGPTAQSSRLCERFLIEAVTVHISHHASYRWAALYASANLVRSNVVLGVGRKLLDVPKLLTDELNFIKFIGRSAPAFPHSQPLDNLLKTANISRRGSD